MATPETHLKAKASLRLRSVFTFLFLILFVSCSVKISSDSGSTSTTTENSESSGESSGGSSTPTAFTSTWDFSTSGDYTVSSATKIAISGNASLQLVDQTHSASADFSSGTHVGTQYTASTLTTGDAGGCDATATNCAELDSSWTPDYSNLVAYWKTENDWTDSISSNDGTATGATFSSSSKIGSYTGSFDGDDYVRFPNAADLQMDSGSFAVSLWMYPTTAETTGGGGTRLINNRGRGTGGSNKGYQLKIADTGSSQWDFWDTAIDDGSTYYFCNNCGDSFNYNQWFHIVMSYEADNEYKLYVNGELDATVSTGVIGDLSNSLPTALGAAIALSGVEGTYAQYHTGYIDDAAVWKGSFLTAEEVNKIYARQSAKYSGQYTSPVMDTGNSTATWTAKSWVTELPFYKELTGVAGSESSTNYSSLVGSTGSTSDNDLMSGLEALWHFNETAANSANGGANDFEDFSGNSIHLDETAGVNFGETGLFESAVKLTASSTEYLSHPTFWDTLPSAISISMWVNLPTKVGANTILWSKSGIAVQDRHYILTRDATDTFSFDTEENNNGYQGLIGNTVIKYGEWTHVVVTWDTTNGKRLYVNGALDVSDPSATTLHRDGTNSNLLIGKSEFNANYYDGYIDEVAAWSRPLDANEITQLYRRGANRIKMQVRSCDDAACSGEAWVGPDGNNDTYLSELNNCDLLTAATGACDFAGGADVNLTSPSLDFTDFTNLSSAVTANQYYQYRVIMESDDDTNSTMPSLSSLTIGPAHYYGDNPTVELATAQSFATLTSFAVTETGTCDHRYQLSNDDGSTYYYYDGASWTAVANVTTHVNTQADVNTNIGTLPVGSGELKWKAILQSDTTENCTIDDVVIGGTQ